MDLIYSYMAIIKPLSPDFSTDLRTLTTEAFSLIRAFDDVGQIFSIHVRSSF